jgi:hypothetical protein
MESEYMALSDASREAIARGQFFQELNIPSMPIVILSDNEAALDLADGTTTNHRKSKHIDIRYHQVRHFVQEGKVEVSHITSEHQIADIFTKALGPQRHHHLVQLMGMRNSYDLKGGGFLVGIPTSWRVPHNRYVGIYKRFFLPQQQLHHHQNTLGMLGVIEINDGLSWQIINVHIYYN